MRSNRWLVVAVAVLGAAGSAREAHAGFRQTAWSFDTTTVPERMAEIEAWMTQVIAGPDGAATTASFLLSPVVGITNQLELAVPITADYSRMSGTTNLSTYGLDARYRIFTSDPKKAPPIVPLVRATVRKLVGNDDAYRFQGTLAVSYEPMPRLHIVANASLYHVTDVDITSAEYSGGALFAATKDLRVGIDTFATQEIKGPGPMDSWFAAGPAAVFSHGRFWLTVSVPFGITSKAPDAMPRMIWAIAF
jgi:hypothetical protein